MSTWSHDADGFDNTADTVIALSALAAVFEDTVMADTVIEVMGEAVAGTSR